MVEKLAGNINTHATLLSIDPACNTARTAGSMLHSFAYSLKSASAARTLTSSVGKTGLTP
jgi:hypothetical protein